MKRREDIEPSLSRMSSFSDKFQDLRNSIRSKITKARDSIRKLRQNLRRSILKKIQNSLRPVRRITDSFRPPSHINAETNIKIFLTTQQTK